ncbi:hypothetical protein ZWY2020_059056 [Hordeum vulgare]|nr:hypothetical protein ZWY2020_059056 [Hordeum vulgare]
MVFIGYERSSGTKAYRFYDPQTEHLQISRDFMFEENKAWNWSAAADGTPTGNIFTVEFPTDDDAGEDVQVVGKTPNQGDHNGSDHHCADTDDDVHRSQGDSDNEAHDTGGDLDDNIDNEAHSDDDNQDDGHDHNDYANDADVDDTPET